MHRNHIILSIYLLSAGWLFSQNSDSLQIRKIYSEALSSQTAYQNLQKLCKETPGRYTGSPQAAKAVELCRQICQDMSLDSIWLQPLKAPRWIPGNPAEVKIISHNIGTEMLTSCALVKSPGTSGNILGKIIEVKSLEEVAKLGTKKISGNIVFYNRPVNPAEIDPMNGYRTTVDQRFYGSVVAYAYGSKAVLVRSITPFIHDLAHTGTMLGKAQIESRKEQLKQIVDEPTFNKIMKDPGVCPAAAISTIDADRLSQYLKQNPDIKISMKMNCQNLSSVQSHNVIAEIKGGKYPDKVILIGGHLDSHFNTEGAHDDGAGCIHAIEVLRLFKELNIQPAHTIRTVLFMDEEAWQSGRAAYRDYVEKSDETHLFAFESDRGAFAPTGFQFDMSNDKFQKIQQFKSLFKPYGNYEWLTGFSGVDIAPLKAFGAALGSLNTNAQGYFRIHHASNDTFENINQRELQLGSAAIASLIYLIDRYGFE